MLRFQKLFTKLWIENSVTYVSEDMASRKNRFLVAQLKMQQFVNNISPVIHAIQKRLQWKHGCIEPSHSFYSPHLRRTCLYVTNATTSSTENQSYIKQLLFKLILMYCTGNCIVRLYLKRWYQNNQTTIYNFTTKPQGHFTGYKFYSGISVNSVVRWKSCVPFV